ncbi:hypothetical protein ACFQ0M_47845 [Kitasatospora aburaviensis]
MDEDALAALPILARGHLRRLREAGRWMDGTDDIAGLLDELDARAEDLAAGANIPPYGWVHSQFHPGSLHLGADGWRLLDFARSFTGPCLLDIASWHGTTTDPDPARLRTLLEAYVAAGGSAAALAPRGGGLPAEVWALVWHRVWTAEWLMEEALRWINDPDQDPHTIAAVRRHLTGAVGLLLAA